MARIIINDLYKTYDSTEAVRGIDLDIAHNEFLVLVGPSGCGKSTTLRMIAGLEAITAGEIYIGERLVNDVAPRDRDIAMVFQNYALYPHMSVAQNMSFGLELRKVPRDEINRRVSEAAEILNIGELLERRPRQLSGGQRQRVAMGRAIVRNPQAFLFDEPLSNLDAKLRVQMRLEIKKLHRELGATSIYVTHDQVEAMTMADKLIVMNEGVAEQVGAPLDIYEYPASAYVAGFIGSPAMNFLACEVAGDGCAVRLNGSGELRLNGNGAAGGGAATAGIRPEHIALCGGGEADLHVTATMVEPLGADTLVHGALAHAGTDGAGPDLTVRLPGIVRLQAGERLPLRIDRDRIHLFDAAHGRRLN